MENDLRVSQQSHAKILRLFLNLDEGEGNKDSRQTLFKRAPFKRTRAGVSTRETKYTVLSWNQDVFARLVLFDSSWVSQRACMFMNWYSAWLAGQHCHVRAARNALAFPAQRIFPETSYHPTSFSWAGPVCFPAATPFRLYKKQNMKRVWHVRQEWTFQHVLIAGLSQPRT